MQLFIDFNEDGTLNRCEVHQSTGSGQALVYSHTEPGQALPTGQPGPRVVSAVPDEVTDAVYWALGLGLVSREAALDRTLSELGSVPAEKLAAVKAAIAAELSK